MSEVVFEIVPDEDRPGVNVGRPIPAWMTAVREGKTIFVTEPVKRGISFRGRVFHQRAAIRGDRAGWIVWLDAPRS